MKKKFKKLMCMMLTLIVVASVFTGCSQSSDVSGKDGKIELELFSNKSESKTTLENFIKEFEKENPNIHIVVNVPPEAGTVLRTRLTKNDIPDILSIGGTATYGELARAGVLLDLTDTEMVKKVQPAYIKMIGKLVGNNDGKVYGIPYATNANGILYNKDMFKELGLDVPKTWDELIATAEKIKAAGKVPFYLTLKDAWTAMIPWNALAANIPSDDFIEKRNSNQTTFKATHKEVAEKMLTLLKYGHDDNFGVGYSDGNTAFAQGKSVMYLQGNWAIPEIKRANPNINVGIFPFPSTNNVERNRLISGVDVLFAVSANTKHKEAALKFIEFMTRKENAEKYIKEQKALSALKGVYQKDEVMEGVLDCFKTGRITSFPDHYYPPGMQVPNLVQEFLVKKDVNAFLEKLDEEWDKVKQH
ncbi:ABC transporter substrate-binding protein [Caloranaerobacter sp. TR13]|uniref:ABC transporter substrate-binding protein n=1 Tax=Caloranaerobacter sp. TR13 TaxID=1302151 RepID=UPI0006D487D7|nr:extracellular solute-binding protein [Caloranaerobacter sp. TR13]KPU26923.1 ABC transporter substrate-binding protein [Caloranaerobacter sp. TR13]